jgi:hypothetical protein
MIIPEILESDYCRGLVRSLVMASELKKIVAALEAAAITVVCFKGATLAVMAYGDLGKREFSDLDIYVARKQVSRALEVLKGIEYFPSCGFRNNQTAGEIEIELDNGSCVVDLHWAFIPKYFGHFEPDYSKMVRVPLPGFEAPTLGPEDMLVYLSADYARDGWHSLKMIKDVAGLIKNQSLDWVEVWRRAGVCRMRRMVSLAIMLASIELEAPVRKEVLERCQRDSRVVELAAKISGGLMNGSLPPDSLRLHWQCMDSWGAKVRYCLRRAFEPNKIDLEYLKLPEGLGWLYFLVRPFRLASLLFNRG